MGVENKNWLDLVGGEFEHPAIVLWRAIELKYVALALSKYKLDEPILDIGCAEGKIANILFSNQKLLGLDIDWEFLKENNKTDVYKALVLADACSLPYKEKVLGSIFSNCVVEHIPNIDGLLNEARRVLKDGGIFLFTVPSDRFANWLFGSVILDKLGLKTLSSWYKRKRNRMLNHFHCYNHNRWNAILKEKGFDLVEYRYYMGGKATFIWDFLALLVFILKTVRLSKYLLPTVNKMSSKYLEKYYRMDSCEGSGLLLVARRRY